MRARGLHVGARGRGLLLCAVGLFGALGAGVGTAGFLALGAEAESIWRERGVSCDLECVEGEGEGGDVQVARSICESTW